MFLRSKPMLLISRPMLLRVSQCTVFEKEVDAFEK